MKRFALAAAAVLALTPAALHAQDAPLKRGDVEKIVREYLLAHPEVLQEAMTELQKRQQQAELDAARSAIKSHAATLFNSPRQVTLGNPNGDVTFVEFFDYNCGYCKRALSDMVDILKSDPKVKVVLKEFPVLGPGSLEAAQVAVAVRMQDPKKYLDFHQRLLMGRGQADKARALAAAKEAGLDVARIERDLKSPEVEKTLDESRQLAEALNLNGTPSYVIGNDVVIGAVGLPTLNEKIKAARQ